MLFARAAGFKPAIATSFLVGAAIAGLPVFAAAQAPARFDPFKPPSAEATCEMLPPSPDEPVPSKSVRSFLEGDEMYDLRFIEVGYDSAGAPLWATIRVDEILAADSAGGMSPRSWQVVPHAYSIRFDRGVAGEGFHVPGMIVIRGRVQAGGRGRVMSAEDLGKVRRLAELLRLRRCDEISGGS